MLMRMWRNGHMLCSAPVHDLLVVGCAFRRNFQRLACPDTDANNKKHTGKKHADRKEIFV